MVLYKSNLHLYLGDNISVESQNILIYLLFIYLFIYLFRDFINENHFSTS